jgi:hypothetical protein
VVLSQVDNGLCESSGLLFAVCFVRAGRTHPEILGGWKISGDWYRRGLQMFDRSLDGLLGGRMRMEKMAMSLAMAAPVSEKAFDEFHLYTIGRPVTEAIRKPSRSSLSAVAASRHRRSSFMTVRQ